MFVVDLHSGSRRCGFGETKAVVGIDCKRERGAPFSWILEREKRREDENCGICSAQSICGYLSFTDRF